MTWEHFHHQADIGIRGIGDSVEQAFEEGAVALMAVICSPEKVEAKECIEIECEAAEKDLLFADWINALIYEMDIRKWVFSRFEVHIEKDKLFGKAWGEPIDTDRHEPAVEVKAATFMELKAYKNNDDQWVVQCVVDV
ncbi:MAG: archease [Planctomycetota bacterium]|jgi:tRNA nucleotidyltransferase (CCA-adding enzyme)